MPDTKLPILEIPTEKEPERDKLAPPLDIQNTTLDNIFTLLIKDKFTPKYSLEGLKKALICKKIISNNYLNYDSNSELDVAVNAAIKEKYKCFVYGEAGKFNIMPSSSADYKTINHLNEFSVSPNINAGNTLVEGMLVGVDLKTRTIMHSYNKKVHDFTVTDSSAQSPSQPAGVVTPNSVPQPPPPQTNVNTKVANNTPGSITNENAWVPVNPPIKVEPCNNDPKKYLDAIDQFDVENNPRYAIRTVHYKKKLPNGTFVDAVKSQTYCNIFGWDVTIAMGCLIFPYYTVAESNLDTNEVMPSEGKEFTGAVSKQKTILKANQPVNNTGVYDFTYFSTKGWVHENDANKNTDWIRQHGTSFGWKILNGPKEAQENANKGRLTVGFAHALSSGGKGGADEKAGHVIIVRPDLTNPYNQKLGPLISQAGGRGHITRAVYYGDNLANMNSPWAKNMVWATPKCPNE